MKKIKLSVLMFIILVTGFVSCSKMETEIVEEERQAFNASELARGIGICCEIGRRKYDCMYGGGLCNCRLCFSSSKSSEARIIHEVIEAESKLVFIMNLKDLPEEARGEWVFDSTDELTLDVEIAKKLGYEYINIIEGTYSINIKGQKARVRLDVELGKKII